jgi:hypothetical protein
MYTEGQGMGEPESGQSHTESDQATPGPPSPTRTLASPTPAPRQSAGGINSASSVDGAIDAAMAVGTTSASHTATAKATRLQGRSFRC